jgi:CHAD domain-containing protein
VEVLLERERRLDARPGSGSGASRARRCPGRRCARPTSTRATTAWPEWPSRCATGRRGHGRGRRRRRGPKLATLARREHRRLAKAIRALPTRASDADLHHVRIQTKRARYAAELAEARKGKEVRRYDELATALQDLLGEHQDEVVAERRIVTAGRGAVQPAVAVAAGRLAQLEVERRARSRAAFPAAWRSLRRQARRTW